jgi:uncharacterized membrane protein YdjX (TVP38/TMEM64 family)
MAEEDSQAKETAVGKGQGGRWGRLIPYVVLIVVFIGLIVFLTVRFGPRLTAMASEPEKLRGLLASFGWKGVLVFMGLQVLQVVVAAIPGEFVQIAGGYVYGTWLGTLYSLTGIVTGSVLVFLVARVLGYPLVKMLVAPKQLEKFQFMINSEKSEVAMFLLFLIPGIPKDILTYIAGITPIKPFRFFVIITVGRLPALLASSYIGHSTQKGNYTTVIILSIAALILFLAGLLLKDKIMDRLHHITSRRKKE